MKHEIICGIYGIKNLINNKMYIGQAIDIYRRWKEHTTDLNKGIHYNLHLQRSWNLYGQDNFEFLILEICSEDELNSKEMFYVEQFDAYKNGYNQTCGGDGSLGYKHSQDVIKKMTKIQIERFQDIRNRKILRDAHEFESKPIYQIDFNGNIVKEWSSANWAAKMLGYSQARIYEALNHRNRKKTYGGYIWIYVDKYDPLTFDVDWYIKRNWNYKTFYQYDSNHNLVNIWESVLKAEEHGFLRSGIYKVNNKNKTYKGFYWTDKMLNEGRESNSGTSNG